MMMMMDGRLEAAAAAATAADGRAVGGGGQLALVVVCVLAQGREVLARCSIVVHRVGVSHLGVRASQVELVACEWHGRQPVDGRRGRLVRGEEVLAVVFELLLLLLLEVRLAVALLAQLFHGGGGGWPADGRVRPPRAGRQAGARLLALVEAQLGRLALDGVQLVSQGARLAAEALLGREQTLLRLGLDELLLLQVAAAWVEVGVCTLRQSLQLLVVAWRALVDGGGLLEWALGELAARLGSELLLLLLLEQVGRRELLLERAERVDGRHAGRRRH